MLPHEKQIQDYEETLKRLKEQNQKKQMMSADELRMLDDKFVAFQEKTYESLDSWARVGICRHADRPHSIDYIHGIADEFVELHGDRTGRDDHALVGGLAKIGGEKFMVIGQEKGHDTESRIHRNFGMLSPEGFRKSLRLMKMAEKFGLPVLSLIDTSGAFPGLEAEKAGQAWAIANNLKEMSQVATPIIVVVIGEGGSGGALGNGIGDVVGILQHAYYSVISPEGCASILFKDTSKNAKASQMLHFNAEHLLKNQIVDEIIEEPLGGAHKDPELMIQRLKAFVLKHWALLKDLPPDVMLENRYQKFRKMGRFEIAKQTTGMQSVQA